MSTRPSSSTSGSELRRFLLGTATESEAEAFSLRILQDASSPDATSLSNALAEEDELIDEYVRGELDDDAARRFERVVLCDAEGRRRVDFARALAERAARHARKRTNLAAPLLAAAGVDPEEVDPETADRDDVGDGSLLRRLFASLHSPAARPAWALCALLFVAVLAQAAWLAQSHEATTNVADAPPDPVPPTTHQPSADVELDPEPLEPERLELDRLELDRLQSEAADLRQRLEESSRQVASLRSDLEQARAAAGSSDSGAQAARVVKLLLAATTRSAEIPTFDAPRDIDPVELQVDLSGMPDLDRVRARLLDLGGFQIWGRPAATVEGAAGMQALRLAVPAGLLSPGHYTLLVQSAGPDGETWQDVALREFRIQGG